MTLDELYEMVKDLKDQKIPGDTEVFVYSANCDDGYTKCSYVTVWNEKGPNSNEKDRFIEIG